MAIITKNFPMLPLRDVVVYPQLVIPLFVGREKSINAIEKANDGDKKILLVAQKTAGQDEPQIKDLYNVGTVANILQMLKWAGIFYIIYLAYDTYTSRIKIINSKKKSLKSDFSFYRDGFLVAGLSPKSIIFFGTIFTSFIDFASNYTAQFLILTITYIILDFLTLMIYAFAANKVSIWFKDNPRVLNAISACVLITIAIYIAVTQSF